jgi:hypothetical protein
VGLRGSIYRGRGKDIDAPHDTEIKPRITENAYNERHLLLRSWREFVKRNFVKRVAISRKCNVIIGSYVPERPKNEQKYSKQQFY